MIMFKNAYNLKISKYYSLTVSNRELFLKEKIQEKLLTFSRNHTGMEKMST